MIVSHAHRFVFVKTKKTAGSSIELALSAVCGPADVITWLDPEDEALRAPGPGIQNFRYSWLTAPAGGIPAIREAIRTRRRPTRFRQHTPASVARRLLGPATWSAYLTFAVERDPFDRAVSMYFWRTRNAPRRPPLSAWLEAERDLSNFPLYSADGVPIVDRIIRYERLEIELAALYNELGLSVPPLPRAKSRYRPSGSNSRQLLSRSDRELIERACHREMDLLGYSF